jgi:hypothetical protein
MDETQQVPNQNPITPVPRIATYPTPQPAPTSKTSWMLISLIVALLGVASYFGYQYYQLKQQMTVLQPTPTPATTIGDSPIPTPTTTRTSTSDPTSNWQTFSHKGGYSIKYPTPLQVVAMKNFDTDPTPIDEYGDIRIGSASGFDNPHLRIIRLAKDASDAGLSNTEVAQKYYQANLDMPAVPATSIQKPKEESFAGVTGVTYSLQNKGYKSIVDEYLGYSGTYKTIWLEKDGYKYMIYWTKTSEMDQIASTFKFTK